MSINDERITSLLKTIEEQKKELGQRPRLVLKSNGIIKIGDNSVNIHTISSLEGCIKLAAEILKMESFVVQAAELLEVDGDLGLQEFDDIIEDLKLKANIIKWNIRNEKVKKLEAKLKNLRSEDKKTSDEIDEIINLLKA